MESLSLFALGKGGVRANAGGLELESIAIEKIASQFDLTLEVTETGDRSDGAIEAVFEYNPDLFDTRTIQRLSNHLINLIQAILRDPSARIGSVPLLSEAESSQLTFEWNDTHLATGLQHTFLKMFDEQVAAVPDGIAVSHRDQQTTYRELSCRAHTLADKLRRAGVSTGNAVGLCASRSLELIEATVAILMSGAVYVPLDPQLPLERLRFIVGDASLKTVVTGPCLSWKIDALGIPNILEVGGDQEKSAAGANDVFASAGDQENCAYIVYTSGSTGSPKGVMVTHASLANHLNWMRDEFPLDGNDRVLQKYSISFDTSILEMLYPLICGAQLVVVEEGTEHDPAALIGLMREREVTAIDVVPVMLGALLETGQLRNCISLKRIMSGGEELSDDVRRRVHERLPALELANLYGPTESTVGATFY
ncbi:MAG: AMP-binding protein, partial [Blastocatellia bacterium]